MCPAHEFHACSRRDDRFARSVNQVGFVVCSPSRIDDDKGHSNLPFLLTSRRFGSLCSSRSSFFFLRYKYDNIIAQDLDMPERTTQEYEGPDMVGFDG